MTVDRRFLKAGDSYTESTRGAAIAKQRAGQFMYNQNRQPFRTEQTPGTQGVPYGGPAGGGFPKFGSGVYTQQLRNQEASYKKARAESFRPETEINQKFYTEQTS
mgnify:CR=1 FL=1